MEKIGFVVPILSTLKRSAKYLSTCSRTTGVTGTPEKLNSKHFLKSPLDKTSCTINSGKRGKREQVKKQHSEAVHKLKHKLQDHWGEKGHVVFSISKARLHH